MTMRSIWCKSRLRRLGVERALVRAGVRDGDQVQVGDLGVHLPSRRHLQPEPSGRTTSRHKAKASSAKEMAQKRAGHGWQRIWLMTHAKGTTRTAQDCARVVVKIGSSSVTGADGAVDTAAIVKACATRSSRCASGTGTWSS